MNATYRAFRERDRQTLGAILTDDIHHVSPFGEYRHRDQMLEAIWPDVGQSWAVHLRIYGNPPEFVVRYDIASADGPRTAMAEFVRFEGDRIAEIEVYLGRPLAS